MPETLQNNFIANMAGIDALMTKDSNCGANAEGGHGFQAGNNCGGDGNGKSSSSKFGKKSEPIAGKKGETFIMVQRKGKALVDAHGNEAPPHIQKLAIPPAWTNVHVNPNPKGTVLAKGTDSKGRTQTRYSESHNARQAAKKFKKTRELIAKRSEIMKELAVDAKNPEFTDRADCLRLVMQTGMRPGTNRETLADHESYGATTLEGRHVIKEKDGSVKLRLVTGKNKGREVDFPITDPSLSKMLLRRKAAAGTNGHLWDVEADDLRDYSKTKDGGGFKTKDHRTALGTETAANAVNEMPVPSDEKEYRESLKQVAAKVASVLGNTPNVALKSYIDPTVFTVWAR